MRLRRRRQKIETGLAQTMAGFIATGLARNAEPQRPDDGSDTYWAQEMEQSALRARTALMALQRCLANATDDPQTLETLALDLTVASEKGATVINRVTLQPHD